MLRACAVFGSLWGCNFSDVVDIGRDGTGGAGGAGGVGGAPWMPSGGQAGAGSIGLGGTSDACGVGAQNSPTWVDPQPTSTELTPGSGGPLRLGEYRLLRVTEHDEGACVRSQPLAQTLWFGDDARGTLVTDYRGGGHFVASFKFMVGSNTIQVTPTCTDPEGPMSEGFFGPFETYSASGASLVLVSATCNYAAEYEFMAVPAR